MAGLPPFTRRGTLRSYVRPRGIPIRWKAERRGVGWQALRGHQRVCALDVPVAGAEAAT